MNYLSAANLSSGGTEAGSSTHIFWVDLGDFNGDGKRDILAGDFTNVTNNLALFAGNGDGTFLAPTVLSSRSSNPDSLAAADFNGDGKLDLLVGFSPGSALFYSGDGAGGFSLASGIYESLLFNGAGVAVLAANLNNDRKPDARVTDYANGVLKITLNSGIGLSLKSPTYTLTLAPGLADIAVGDLNGDGLTDIVLTNNITDQIGLPLCKVVQLKIGFQRHQQQSCSLPEKES